MELSWSRIAAKLAGRKQEEPESRAASAVPAGPQLIIGLDFGTSGTKVVVRDAMAAAEPPTAINFGTPREMGFSSFSFPSTIAIAGGTLLYGAEAERSADRADEVHRSTKRSLLRIAKSSSDPDQEGRNAHRPPIRTELVHEFLSTMYLAEVMRSTWQVLEHAFPQFDRNAAIINLDVPVSSLGEDSKAADTFRRILRVARVLSLEPPVNDLDRAGRYWLDARRSLPPLLEPGERREEVIPEAVATIAGLGEVVKRGAWDANFAVVDIGAGTTDLGFFRFPDREARRAVFYSAMTAPFGCDDVDRAICRQLGFPRPTAKQLGLIRLKKTQFDGRPLQVFDSAVMVDEYLRQATDQIAGRATQAWKTAFGQAYNKERVESRWKDLDVFLVGGGSLVPGLSEPYRLPPWNRVRTVRVRQINRDLSLSGAGAESSAPESRDMIFLLAALGLSLPTPDRPEMQHPDAVPDWKMGPLGPSGLYDFDPDDK